MLLLLLFVDAVLLVVVVLLLLFLLLSVLPEHPLMRESSVQAMNLARFWQTLLWLEPSELLVKGIVI